MSKTFKPGAFVLYKPKDADGQVYKTEYGVVKRMNNDGTKAFVWFHWGCTATSTPVEFLEETWEQYGHMNCHRGCAHCMPHQFQTQEDPV